MTTQMQQVMFAAAALVMSVTTAGAQAPLAEGRLAWWQFDQGAQSETREISNRDADLNGPGFFVNSDIGVGQAARFWPGSVYSFTHPESLPAEHWSKVPASGVLTGYLVVTGDEEPDDDGGTLVSTWSHAAAQAWRVRRAATSGEIVLEVARVGDDPVVIESGATIEVDETSFIFWTINEVEGEIALQVWQRGALVSWLTAPYDTTVPNNSAQLQVGRDSFQSGTAPRVRVDLLAFWDRELAFGDRVVLVNGGAGIGYADLFLSNLPAPGIELDRAEGIFSGDVRHIFLGDSLVSHLGTGRVPVAMLRVAAWPDLNTVSWGLTSSDGSAVRTVSADLDGDALHVVNAASDFQCEYDALGDGGDYYGVPVRDGIEVRIEPGMAAPEDGVFWRTTLQNSVFEGGATERLTTAGDTLRVRAIYRLPSDPAMQYPEYRLHATDDSASVIGAFDATTPRQVAAASNELLITENLDGNPAWTLGVVDPMDLKDAEESWFNLYGYVCSTSPFGQQFGALGHDSWTWRGIGNDVESTGNKAYSTEQFTHWLDATAVNPAARHVFWVHCDLEDRNEVQMIDAFERITLKVETACATLGIDDWIVIVLIPYMQGDGRMAPDEVRQAHHDTREALRVVASAHERVCSFSIYDATDGVLFDGSSAAQAWLLANGYDAFPIGDDVVDLVTEQEGLLLGQYLVHPRDAASAAFFADLAVDAIAALEPPPCPVDLNGDGAVDFNDLLLVLASWGTCNACPADFDASGVVDFNDIIALLALWGECRL